MLGWLSSLAADRPRMMDAETTILAARTHAPIIQRNACIPYRIYLHVRSNGGIRCHIFVETDVGEFRRHGRDDDNQQQAETQPQNSTHYPPPQACTGMMYWGESNNKKKPMGDWICGWDVPVPAAGINYRLESSGRGRIIGRAHFMPHTYYDHSARIIRRAFSSCRHNNDRQPASERATRETTRQPTNQPTDCSGRPDKTRARVPYYSPERTRHLKCHNLGPAPSDTRV